MKLRALSKFWGEWLLKNLKSRMIGGGSLRRYFKITTSFEFSRVRAGSQNFWYEVRNLPGNAELYWIKSIEKILSFMAKFKPKLPDFFLFYALSMQDYPIWLKITLENCTYLFESTFWIELIMFPLSLLQLKFLQVKLESPDVWLIDTDDWLRSSKHFFLMI